MTPWLQDPDVTLYHGDVLYALRELPAESVDCVVTSPPYWGLRDYGVDDQIGLEPTPEQYVERMVEVFREVRRVLAAHGTVWLNLGDSYASQGGERTYGSHDGETGRGEAPGPRIGAVGLKPKDLVGIPWRVARALQEPYYTGKIRDERDRIWLAATVEAEGCLFIHKRKAGQSNGQGYERKNDSYGAGLEVASTDRAIVEKCLAITGLGSICEQTPKQNDRRKQTIYRWNLRSNVCREVIRELYPHFVAKHHEARLLLGCPSSGEKAARAHESLKALHRGETPSIDFAPPETLFEPGWYLRSDIVWFKCNPMPESVTDRPTKAHEYVFLLSKQPRYFFDQEAVREKAEWARWGDQTNGKHADSGSAASWIPDRKKGELQGGRQRRRYDDNEFKTTDERNTRYQGPSPADGGRNIRSVWEIATQPYPEAHFATFPEELARRCIAAGCPEQVCRVCGKARERIIDKPFYGNLRTEDNLDGHADLERGIQRNRFGGQKRWEEIKNDRTDLGLTDCCHADYRPGIVFDPFMGSGTVAYVARKLGRHAVGIDLSESYLKLAARRLQQQSLFAEMA